jgi:hypothetical protein
MTRRDNVTPSATLRKFGEIKTLGTRRGVAMKIFVQPRSGDSFDRTVRHAVEILLAANIQSAQAGGTINQRAVVLIDPDDIPEAMATLERDGLRVTVT